MDEERVDFDVAVQDALVPEGCVLTNYVIITQFMDQDGDLQRDIDFKEGMDGLLVKGMLFDALFGDLQTDKEEE